ncbi:MAG: penicillin-binding protein 2 [Elusimicrobia bacterium]|nr:penicillin-binding protein 2 [Elusimicrobiota bacterium]
MLIQEQTLEIMALRKKKVIVLGVIIVLGFVFLFLRLFYIQVLNGRYFRRVADENRIQRFYQKASRGQIYDRYQKLLAVNMPSFVVSFTSYSLNQQEIERISRELAGILNLSFQEVKTKTFSSLQPLDPVIIAADISREQALTIIERKASLPGVNVSIEPKRQYPEGNLACHVIGYVGELNLEEYKDLKDVGYRIGDRIGKTGLEAYYDKLLKGDHGEQQIEISASGRQLRLLRETASLGGNDLELTIDAEVQRLVQDALQGVNGAAVVMNPRTGEVIALASSPVFDPNIFLRPITRGEFQYLFKNRGRPLFNKAIQAQYPPGSGFKIITTAAGLQEGFIIPEEKLECIGEMILGTYNQVFKCWKKDGHGKVSLASALAQSCDVYYYQLGFRLGVTRVAGYAKNFGLGSLTGIDLPSEKKGIVPDRDWKRKAVKEAWYDGDTLNMCIGQGYLWVTPLQMANIFSAVANDGPYYRPKVVKRIISPGGKVCHDFFLEEQGLVELDRKNWQIIKQGLEDAVTFGTGRQAYIKGLRVAGKTGTAQNPQGIDHAWFGCLAPVDNPQIVVVVFVEHGGHGGVVAAPIARRILEGYFKKTPSEQWHVASEESGD